MYGVVLGGWSSGSKYSLLGALRGGAQVVSYELVLGLALVGVVLVSGTLSIGEIVDAAVAARCRTCILQPLGFVLYFIAAIAETNRAPFDLPEAEQELVAGYHTEYSGFRFALYYIAEYVNVITVSAIAATLFFGGWTGPFNLLRAVVAADQDGLLRVCLRLAAGDAAAPALRPADAALVGRAAAARLAQCARDRGARRRATSGGAHDLMDADDGCARPGQGLLDDAAARGSAAADVSYPEVKRAVPAGVPRAAPAVSTRRRARALHRLRAVRGGVPVGGDSTSRPPTTIRRIPTSTGERFAAIYEINMIRCIFCGYCEEACPVDAIRLGPEYELADFDRKNFVYTKEMLLDPEKFAPAAAVPRRRDEQDDPELRREIPADEDLGEVYRNHRPLA